MGVYSLDKASPKKAAAGLHRTGFADLKRRLGHRRYFCLWVFVAIVPCYLLRQIYFYETPVGASHTRQSSSGTTRVSSERVIPYDKPTEVKTHEKSLSQSSKTSSTTIKVAQYDSIPPPLTKAKENVTGNSLKLKLKDNFEDDGDFGVPEDNDRDEEQFWRAPPAPAKKLKVQTSRR